MQIDSCTLKSYCITLCFPCLQCISLQINFLDIRHYSNSEMQEMYIQTPVSTANKRKPEQFCDPPVCILIVCM